MRTHHTHVNNYFYCFDHFSFVCFIRVLLLFIRLVTPMLTPHHVKMTFAWTFRDLHNYEAVIKYYYFIFSFKPQAIENIRYDAGHNKIVFRRNIYIRFLVSFKCLH